jgi:fructose-bisphosphate aldolase class II
VRKGELGLALVNLVELLSTAQDGAYAVGAFDVVSAEYARAIVGAAEQERSPLVLMVLEGYQLYSEMEILIPSLCRLAERSSVPVAVHLDHATRWETVVKAVQAGCTSVMLDRSGDPYRENVAQTREVVRLCTPLNVSVESEIGSVKGSEAIGSATLATSDVDPRYFTQVEEAERFARDTQVDALAVSVGNTHGWYKGRPELDLERIEAISKLAAVPLVLHGGSGLSDQDFRNAIRRGMRKVNINTSLIAAAGGRVASLLQQNPESLNYPELLYSAHQAVAAEARRLMGVFGCAGRA